MLVLHFNFERFLESQKSHVKENNLLSSEEDPINGFSGHPGYQVLTLSGLLCQALWKEWIPNETECVLGKGLVDSRPWNKYEIYPRRPKNCQELEIWGPKLRKETKET